MPIDIEKLQHLSDHLSCGGEITIGPIGPVDGASAGNEGTCYAMLSRRVGETLSELLARLDDAIRKAVDDDDFTDEINV